MLYKKVYKKFIQNNLHTHFIDFIIKYVCKLFVILR